MSAGITPRSVKKTIWAYGDSLTQSGYPSYLQPLVPDAYVRNFGLGGQGTRHIAARMGAISVTMTVSGDSVSSGANTVTHINGYAIGAGMGNDGGDGSLDYQVNQFLSFAENTTQSVTGTLNGIHGTLTRTATGTFPATTETYTFTPDAGETLPASVPSGSTWQTDTDYLTVNPSEDIVSPWVGQNDMGWGEQTERFGGYIGSLITLLENSGNNYIVMGPVTWTTSDTAWQTGGGFYNEVETANATLASLAGDSYFDVAAFLRTDALSYAGLTATTEDLADIAAGMPPRQLRKSYTAPDAGWDAVHFNANGYAAIAQRLSEIKAARGL